MSFFLYKFKSVLYRLDTQDLYEKELFKSFKHLEDENIDNLPRPHFLVSPERFSYRFLILSKQKMSFFSFIIQKFNLK